MKTYFKTTAVTLALGVLLGLVSTTKPVQAKQGGAGWQTPVVFNVPTGYGSYFYHMDCPAGYSVQDGGFQVTSTTQGNGFLLSGNGPRLDISPANFNEWAWNFRWDNGGSPQGSIIVFDVLCKKGAP